MHFRCSNKAKSKLMQKLSQYLGDVTLEQNALEKQDKCHASNSINSKQQAILKAKRVIWAPSSENVSSEVCDRVTFKPAC